MMSRCRFIEGAPNIDEYWLSADVFAFPSSNEGFGIVIAEAAGAGLPVAASDIPGVREAATACPVIRLLPVASSADHWAATLEELLALAPMPEATRIEMLARFPFTIQTSIESLLDLYAGARN